MIYVINRPELLALEFYKLRPFKGSDKGIRYMIQKDVVEIEPEGEKDQTEEDAPKETKTVLTAFIWPEPFCFEKTPEEQKTKQAFSFDEEGLDQAYDWICKQYEDRKDQWQQYHKHPFEGMF